MKSNRKRVRMMKPAPEKRIRLGERVRRELDPRRKLETALGFAHSSTGKSPLQHDEELFGLLRDVDRIGKAVTRRPVDDKAAQVASYLIQKIGIAVAIAVAEKDHRVFERLASILRHRKQPRFYTDHSSETYACVGGFCYFTGTGTKERPCDGAALTEFLELRLHKKFPRTYDNENIPVAVRRLCKKLGIVLAPVRQHQ